jgi:hypothetical protein
LSCLPEVAILSFLFVSISLSGRNSGVLEQSGFIWQAFLEKLEFTVGLKNIDRWPILKQTVVE